MEQARDSWVSKAEMSLKGLRDVSAASIEVDGDDITVVHILSPSTARPAKQIVRDVQTLLLTRFNRAIDHRKVSVAPFKEPAVPFLEADSPREPVSVRVAGPAVEVAAPEPAPAHRPRDVAKHQPEPRNERIRFLSANLFVNGLRVQAQVELHWKGLPRLGTATGLSTRDGAHRLVAQATLAAIQEFMQEEMALSLEGIEVAQLGKRQVAVVGLELIAHREHKGLSGCCTVEQDIPQAVVLATLSAVNRVLGGLDTKEPTEYVLRPTTT